MRADRLVSILMLLQSRGQVPARELAETLGVSVRTIFRDMDALSAAGIPVYSERGSAGGCRLVEDYRTDLTGLNPEEARSLFLLTAPGPLDALEVGQELRSALRKLAAALPGYLASADRHRPRITLDWTGWGRRPVPGEQLGLLYRAVQRQQHVRLTYRMLMEIEIEVDACPLGLAAKTGEWYLACLVSGKLRWQRAADLLRVELLDSAFEYPPDFDLQAAWQAACAEWEVGQAGYTIQARATAWALAELRRRQGVTVHPPPREPGPAEWVEVELAFRSYEAARQNLMGLGRAIEVISPGILRLGIVDYARQILGLYAPED